MREEWDKWEDKWSLQYNTITAEVGKSPEADAWRGWESLGELLKEKVPGQSGVGSYKQSTNHMTLKEFNWTRKKKDLHFSQKNLQWG